MKIHKRSALILKLDLSKAFDRVNWTFLHLILIQIGVALVGVNWIMGCISSANFSILVNGTPSSFFPATRGIRQGCPLSPLLFILVIEGLNLLIAEARRIGKLKGIKISPQLFLTHLLFVDDVLLFGMGSYDDWLAFKEILDTFCEASDMCISSNKSCFLHNDLDEDLLRSISSILPYKFDFLNKGFVYLGYFLKPSGYLIKDWHWLVKKFEKRISNWTNRFLSLGGA